MDRKPQSLNIDFHDFSLNRDQIEQSAPAQSRNVQTSLGIEELAKLIDRFKNMRYFCIVPLVATLSENELRRHAVPITGVRQFDRSAKYEMVERFLSIEDMMVIRRRNFSIQLYERSDCQVIYDQVVEYINVHSRNLERAFSISPKLLQDLIDLDELAKDLFPHLPREGFQPWRDLLDSRLRLMINVPEFTKPHEYNSMADYLKQLQERG